MLRTCSLGALVLLLAIPLRAQFQPRVDYPVGPSPFSVAVGDFNGDGHLDLAVTNSAVGNEVGQTSNGVSILLGNGDGTFQPHVDYPAGIYPNSVITADFNRDGKLDLAITNGYTNSVDILLGNGDGTFTPHAYFGAGTNPEWIVAADLNGDGILDLATANYGPGYSGGTVSVFLGNGDGTFQSQVQYDAGVNPFGIMAEDFNHDGKIDLLVVNNNGGFGVRILFGNGDGTFQPAVYFPSGTNPRVGVVADLNGDGNLDIGIANCISNNLSILMGDGTGNFSGPVDYAGGTCPQTLAGGDFYGNGILDLVTANSGDNDVTVFKGNGDGTFQPPAAFATGSNPYWVTVADFNNDKAPDLVVTNYSDNTVSVLLNKGTDFSISATPANPSTVTAGQTSSSTLSLSLLTWFNSPVTLSCSAQPAQSAPTCSFSSNPVSFANGVATATMTLDTGTTVGLQAESLRWLWLPIAGFALLGAGVRSPRKKPTACVLGLFLVAGLMFQVACAGGTAVQKKVPQTYTITVTGTSGANQHSTTTTLTVQ